MRLLENPLAAEELVRDAQARRERENPRLPGLHVSDLIYCLRKSWYRLQDGGEPELDTDTLTMFLAGHGHHAMIEHGQTEVGVILQLGDPPEPVHGTIDYMPRGSQIPHEIKTTRASSEKPPEQSAHYIDQLASYVLAAAPPLDPWGVLVILHLNGNTKNERRPTLKWWDVRFTVDELTAWLDVLNERVELLRRDVPPPLDEHYQWECKFCPYGPQGDKRCPGGDGRLSFWSQDNLPDWIGDGGRAQG